MAASDASQPAAGPERRIAENGRPYTKEQFMHYYKSAGEFRWKEAEARRPPTDGSAAQPPAEDVIANQQDTNQQEDAMGSTEGSPADRSAAIPAIAASPAITAVDAGHGTHLAAAQLPDVPSPQHVIAPSSGLQAPALGLSNILIESFVGSEDRAASQVPIAPSHTDLGVAQMGAFDAQAHILAQRQENPEEIESVTTHLCGNAMASTDVPPAHRDAAQLPAVLLPQHVIAIQQEEASREPPRSLHRLARDALNAISKSPTRSIVNLNGQFPWVQYVCAHPQSATIIGPGITHAQAVFVPNTNDDNRGGAQRLNFCFYRTDSTVCLVHPGNKHSQDAQLRIEPM